MFIRRLLKILFLPALIGYVLVAGSCRKKETFIEDASAKLTFSTDSVLFDTVFTTVGSSTRNFRIHNKNNQRIRISSIRLADPASPFFLNVDGEPGKSFSDIEIAPHDCVYVFVQVFINPLSTNSEMIITDQVVCTTNGNEQVVNLEAWGQNAYYHYPTRAIHFSDGSYLPYSLVDTLKDSYTKVGDEFVWKNDKPHVIYGYLVVDSLQKLRIPAGTEIYLNYKAGLWVYRYGRLQVLGTRGNEVRFQGARRERDYIDEPGQWDRIWINEGSDQNVISYAIIKDGFIGVQAELFDYNSFLGPGLLNINNTIIQNMSMWGFYGMAYKVIGFNNVVSDCQDHAVNLKFGGVYQFYHCTFANNWDKDKPREKSCLNINNYTETQVLDHAFYFGNCIIDGNRDNELNIDIKTNATIASSFTFSSCFIKTNTSTNSPPFMSVRTSTESLKYEDGFEYKFHLHADETRASGFTDPRAGADAAFFPRDLDDKPRNTVAANGITVGAYEK